MKTLQFIIFGERDVHDIEGIRFDSSCVAVMVGDREDIEKMFDSRYSTIDTPETWQPGWVVAYPRGYVLVPPSALIKEKQKETWEHALHCAFRFKEVALANEEPASSAIAALMAYLRYKEKL